MGKSEGEEVLAFQLKAAKIPFEREYTFAKPRRWRFDFVIGEYLGDPPGPMYSTPQIAVEVEGGAFNGGHRRGVEANKDCEKSNAAVMAGWKVLRFTPVMVDNGRALETIEAALGKS